MTERLQSLTAELLARAKAAGASAADAMAVDGTSISIDVRNGRLEQAERSEGIEIGLRVLVGRRQAIVSASDTSAQTIDTMAERAEAMAREAPEDDSLGLADPSELAVEWDLAALELADPTSDPAPAELEEDARRAEAASLSVKGVSQCQSTSAGYHRRNVHIAASNGFSGGYERTSRGISAVAITGEGLGMERDWSSESRVFQADLPDAAEIGRQAGQRAAERAGARKPATGAYPVVFDERVAASLVGHLLAAANGSAVTRGVSWLRDALGQQVLPTALSVVEDPHRPRISASRPFDAEGLATARRAIVENGILTGWTLDLGTARRLGMKSTASAARGVGSPPGPSVTNIALTQGDKSRADLLAEMGTGLLVTSLIGSSINATTGDYSRGASGFWVENGAIAYPVNECTIAGNLRDMLMAIIPANDARPHLSHVVPSLLVEGLTLAGA
ncbi:MAG: TldD/PmbA family protein [Rhodobacteraceae bacterium]|nr:TldD/PmbA family protein [Paracoccaceae bacterium]